MWRARNLCGKHQPMNHTNCQLHKVRCIYTSEEIPSFDFSSEEEPGRWPSPRSELEKQMANATWTSTIERCVPRPWRTFDGEKEERNWMSENWIRGGGVYSRTSDGCPFPSWRPPSRFWRNLREEQVDGVEMSWVVDEVLNSDRKESVLSREIVHHSAISHFQNFPSARNDAETIARAFNIQSPTFYILPSSMSNLLYFERGSCIACSLQGFCQVVLESLGFKRTCV